MSKVGDFFANLFGRGTTPQVIETMHVPRGSMLGTTFDLGSSDGSKWDLGLSTSGAAPKIDHNRARRNARSAYLDSIQTHSIVNRMSDSVVDQGLRLKCSPMADTIGVSEERAARWARNVEHRFHLWAKDRKGNRQEIVNFYQFQRLIFTSQLRDGEYFVRLYYNNRRDLQNPLQFRAVDPGLVRCSGFTDTSGYQFLEDGIERDAAGREIAYHIMSRKADGLYEEIRIPAVGSTGRRVMLHGFRPDWPEQIRGYPQYFHALQEFENVTDFSLAHVKKAINQSMITMYVKPNSDNPASNPLANVSVSNPVAPIDTTLIEESDHITAEPRLSYVPIPEATFNAPGSVGVFNLMEGEDLKPFNDSAPVQEFGNFVNAFTSHLAASMSIPLEVVLMQFNANYSASRAALILFWRVAQIWRAELASDLLNPVFESWLSGEIASGRVIAPGWSDPRIRNAWLHSTWSGVPMPNIDPQKTAKADQLYVEMGAQTLQDVAQNLNGSEIETNKSQLARELENLPTPPWGKRTESAETSAIPEDSEDE